MKQKRGKRKTLSLRITQKPILRYAATGIAISFIVGLTFYLNFSQSDDIKAAEKEQFQPTYKTIDADVPSRLLLKAETNQMNNGSNNIIKKDSSVIKHRKGRSLEIKQDRYLSE
jgi:hypothetical protein